MALFTRRSSRRSFLIKVGLGLIAFVPATRALTKAGFPEALGVSAQVPPNPTLPEPKLPLASVSEEVDPRYASGTVLAVRSDRIELLTPYAGPITIAVTPQTQVWEGLWVKDIPLEQGDRLIVWGERRADGILSAHGLWVGLTNIRGVIRNVNGPHPNQTFEVQDQGGEWLAASLNPRTGVADLRQQSASPGQRIHKDPLESRLLDLNTVRFVQVIGRQLKSGMILVTSLYIDA